MGYLYKLIAREIWQLNPYIELHFSSNPVMWLCVKAHKIVNAVNQKTLNRKDF